MAREYPRSRRIEEQIQRILSELIRSQVRDPRVTGIVLTEVRVSRDLGVAKIAYAVLGTAGEPSPAERAGMQAGLERATGFLRSHLARSLATRTVPELRFRYDEAGPRGRALAQLIDTAVDQDAARHQDDQPGPGDPVP